MQHLIYKYLEGKASANEQKHLLKWLQKTENRAEFSGYSLSWKENLDEKNIPPDQVENWKKFEFRILEKGYQQWQSAKKINLFFRIAAIFFFAVTIAGLSWYFIQTKPDPPLFYTNVVAEKGHISKVELPDGSRVWLNSGSEITYSNLFGDKNRALQLVGEAYFDVAQDKLQALVVNCGELNVKVHGTKFNIDAYHENNFIDVVLEEGSIELLDPNVEAFNYHVQPGERALFNKEKRKLNMSNVNTTKFTSWKEGIINIYDQSLEQVVKKLEVRYSQKFKLEKDVKDLHYTFTIKNESLDEIIELMEKITPVNAIQENDIIIFKLNKAKMKRTMK